MERPKHHAGHSIKGGADVWDTAGGGVVDTVCSDTSLETDRCDEGQSMSLILWLPKRGYLSQPLECGRYSEDVY